jgi:hypothetical protein
MRARVLFVSLGLMVASTGLFAQQAEVNVVSSDDIVLSSLKRLTMPILKGTRPLPYKKDNTRQIYFSGIYNQSVWNCNQAGSIWTMFTYEINYLRNLNSTLPENQYSPMAVFNLLNYANPGQGVSYFDSWNLVKANGIPGNTDFTAYNQNSAIWMTGYDKYYRGMKNRVDEVFAIDVGTPDGLLTLKHWINDHLDGSQIGGLANFQIGSDGMDIPQIPLDKGLEEEGQYIVTKYGPYVGHCMTFAGWNDSVRYDVNFDGKYTNNIDINGDNIVDMRDWEIGAMLVVNSWGVGYGNGGKLWVMYRLLAQGPETGGIWNKAAMVVKPKKVYEPLLTVKTKIRYNQRNRLKIQVGISSNVNSPIPEKVIDFPCFNYQGDPGPMQGIAGVDNDLIEIGLDITPLMNYVPDNGRARIYLEVVQKAPNAEGSGGIESFSVMDYTHGITETALPAGTVTINRNAVTRVSVPITTTVVRPEITTSELPDGQVGQEYRVQIEADGTTGPYRYANPATWFVEKPETNPFSFTGGASVFTIAGINERVMDLPFMFPFYGKNYSQVTILKDGGIIMGQNLVKYPYVIDNRMRFYQNIGAFPFLSTLWYPDASDQVTFSGTIQETIIRWHAAADADGNQPLEFAAKLLPDGTITFYYGNMMVTPDMAWISGLSEGNNLDYYLLNNNISGMKVNTAFTLSLLNWPSWLSLGINGDLLGTPQHNGLYTLPLKVYDWEGITNYKELTVKVTGGSGVDAPVAENEIRVYPNPSAGAVWLKGNAANTGLMVLNLYDITGTLVFSRNYNVPAGPVLISVEETKTLPAGIYFFRLKGVIEEIGKFIRQ